MVQRALRTAPTQYKNNLSAYVKCRMNPFGGYGTQGIPDGANSDYVISDFYATDTITTLTQAGFKIQTLSTLPITACVKGLGAAAVNDLQVNSLNYDNPSVAGITGDGGYFPLGIPSVWKGSWNFLPGASPQDNLGSAKIRLVGVGYCLTYTGKASDCAGVAVITPNDWALSPTGIETNLDSPALVAGDLTVNVIDSTGLAGSYVDRHTGLIQATGSSDPNMFTKDSVVHRLDRKLYILPRHTTADFKIIPVSSTCSAIGPLNGDLSSSAAINHMNLFASNGPASTQNSSIFWYDNDWRNFQVVVTGMGTGATYRWDTVFCVEVNPKGSSVMANFAKKVSPMATAEIKLANSLVNNTTPGTLPAAGRP